MKPNGTQPRPSLVIENFIVRRDCVRAINDLIAFDLGEPSLIKLRGELLRISEIEAELLIAPLKRYGDELERAAIQARSGLVVAKP